MSALAGKVSELSAATRAKAARIGYSASPEPTAPSFVSSSIHPYEKADVVALDAVLMTKADFTTYQMEQVTGRLTEKLIDAIRDAVLRQNENGELLEHRITPAVFTDDWVLRATRFVNGVCADLIDNDIHFLVNYRKKGLFMEHWLLLRAAGNDLPLAMFAKREDGNGLRSCIECIMGAVHTELRKLMPDCDVKLLNASRLLLDSRPTCFEQPATSTMSLRIRATMDRAKAMQASGASKAEIKEEMKRMRKAERGSCVNQLPAIEDKPIISGLGDEEKDGIVKETASAGDGLWHESTDQKTRFDGIWRRVRRDWTSATAKADNLGSKVRCLCSTVVCLVVSFFHRKPKRG